MPKALNDEKFLLFSDSKLPTCGWIQACFTCYIPTAQTACVNENIYKLICERQSPYSKQLKHENCIMFLCFSCKDDINDGRITDDTMYKYCDDFIRPRY